jgi:hypothetical protein
MPEKLVAGLTTATAAVTLARVSIYVQHEVVRLAHVWVAAINSYLAWSN